MAAIWGKVGFQVGTAGYLAELSEKLVKKKKGGGEWVKTSKWVKRKKL